MSANPRGRRDKEALALGGIDGGKERIPIARYAPEHGVRNTGGVRGARAGKLHPLAHRSDIGRRQEEHLERGEAHREADVEVELLRVVEMHIERRVERAARSRRAQGQTRGERGVACIEPCRRRFLWNDISHVSSLVRGASKGRQRHGSGARGRTHASAPQVPAWTRAPAAHAAASISRLPSGLTETSSRAPSEQPR